MPGRLDLEWKIVEHELDAESLARLRSFRQARLGGGCFGISGPEYSGTAKDRINTAARQNVTNSWGARVRPNSTHKSRSFTGVWGRRGF